LQKRQGDKETRRQGEQKRGDHSNGSWLTPLFGAGGRCGWNIAAGSDGGGASGDTTPPCAVTTFSIFGFSRVYRQGTTKRVSIVEPARPPITARARGRFISSPGCRWIAIGASPTSVARVVIRIGRRRTPEALRMASVVRMPSSRWRLANSTTSTELDTEIPTIMSTPMHD
jgi:hypothetical protein